MKSPKGLAVFLKGLEDADILMIERQVSAFFEPKTVELFRHEKEPFREHIVQEQIGAHACRIKLMVPGSQLGSIIIPIPKAPARGPHLAQT